MRQSTIRITFIVVLCCVTAAAAGTPAGLSVERGPKPPENLGFVLPGLNGIDFSTKALLGPMGTDAVAYVAATNHVYVGNRQVLSVYNVIDPANPALVGQLDLPVLTFYGSLGSIHYPGSGDFLYAVHNVDGLYTIDITNPVNPVVADVIGPGGSNVWIDGTLAYVAAGIGGLQIHDISDPRNMSFVGAYDPSEGSAWDVFVANGHAYMAAVSNLFAEPSVWVIDATTPTAPVFVNELISYTSVRAVTGVGNRLYVVASNWGLAIYDVATPASPIAIGSGGSTLGRGSGIEVSGARAYIGTGEGLEILNIGNPASLSQVGVSTGVPSYGASAGLDRGNGFVFVSAGNAGLQVADIDPETSPEFVASLPSPGQVREVAASGDHAYFGSWEGGLFIVDVSDINRPRVVSVFESEFNIHDVVVENNLLFFTDFEGIHILDVSDPSDPTQLGLYDPLGSVDRIDVQGSLLYGISSFLGLVIADVSDPTTPVEIGTLALGGGADNLRVVDDYAYVANGAIGLAIIDVGDPTNPAHAGGFVPAGSAGHVDVSSDSAFVIDSTDLLVLDVSTPTSPLFDGLYTAPGSLRDVRVQGSLAYANTLGSVRVVDVDVRSSPTEVGYLDANQILGVAVANGYAFATENQDGATILHHEDQCIDAFEPDDQFADASYVAAGTIYSTLICDANDVDHYAIVTATGGTLDITMQPPSGQDYNLFLYDSLGNLIGASTSSGDTTEQIVRSVTGNGPHFVKVAGHTGSFDENFPYSLFYFFESCPAPAHPVYVFGADLDDNLNTVLFVQDPNQASTVTGYNLYRSTSPVGPFDLIGENLSDFDDGTPNVQLVDVDSASCGPLCFYRVTAFNSACGAEGPQ